MNKILELKNVTMKFSSGDSCISVLDGINFSIEKGESIALVGQSGAGKSTFLQISALLEQPNSGEILINGILTNNLTDNEKTKLRRENIGFVYQFHNLLPEFSVLENVIIPQLITNRNKKDAVEKAKKALKEVSLFDRIYYSPKKLSGGEQQRVAIARALVNNPKLIIADEPTGNLDPKTAGNVFEIFLNLIKNEKTSVIMATHNLALARQFDRILRIENGNLLEVSKE
ncbi:MAG: ABC transporter ATP-binding protein [Holosporales bacterium]|jgi:lipoprotein-releasing system ATP-binding protein|nr:ABC transporter ATP-binding protein [Holosporales bacterium]